MIMSCIRQLLATLLLLTASLPAAAEPARLDNLQQLPEQQVLLLLVSQPGCTYCEQIKEEIIMPMIRSGLYDSHTLIRQIVINNDEYLIDYNGNRTSTTAFAHGYQAWATPTLLFLDNQGNELAPRMIGINTPEYYGYYVDRALEQSRALLMQRSTQD